MDSFKALVADKTDEGTEMSIKVLEIEDLTEGDVLIDVHYSSVNYKDGMVAAKGEIAEYFPIIPGIDLAGEVIESKDDKFKKGMLSSRRATKLAREFQAVFLKSHVFRPNGLYPYLKA